MAALDLGALAEDGVGLVEEEHGVGAIGLGEDPLQVLLRLAHVLVDDGGELDDVEVEAEFVGDDLGGERLTRPRLAREEREHAAPPAAARAEPPVPEHLLAVAAAQGEFAQVGEGVRGQDEVVPTDVGDDAPRVLFEPRGGVVAGRPAQVRGGERGAVEGGEFERRGGGAAHAGAGEPVRGDGRGEVEVRLRPERAGPQLGGAGVRGRRVQEHGGAPLGVEGRLPGEDERHLPGAERADERGGLRGQRRDDEDGVAQSRFEEQGLGGEFPVLGRRAVQRLAPGGGERGARAREPVALAPLAQVRERGQRTGEERGEPLGERVRGRLGYGPEQPGEHGIGGVVAEEVRDEAVRYAQDAAEEGRLGLVDAEQAEADERGRGVEAGAGPWIGGGEAAQVEGEAGGGAAAAHVVVEVAVQRLEGAVDVGREREEQDRLLGGGEAAARGERGEAVAAGRGFGRYGPGGGLGAVR